MTKNYPDRVKTVLHIATAVAAVAAGACLIAACWGIYRSGEQPFSRESVAAAFAPISLPVYLCLGLILTGWLVQIFLPDRQKRTGGKQIAYMLQRLQKTKDLDICGPTLKQDILAQRKKRLECKWVTALLTAVGFGVFLCFALQPEAFHPTEINRSTVRILVILLLCMVIPFGCGIFTLYFCRRSMEMEIALLKMAPAKQVSTEGTSPVNKINGILVARIALLCVAAALLICGFATGGIADVLTKAINICTECVGLG